MDLTGSNPRKTYWHLSEAQRMPSRYEIVTSKLLYYPDKGFSVQTPVVSWYERHVAGSPIPAACYAQFSDPRSVTYRQYVQQARDREIALRGAYEAAAALNENEAFGPGWRRQLKTVLPVLPFFFHGLQMQAAYCGQLAPEGKLVAVMAFKAANGMRRIQNLSQRLGVLAPELDWPNAGREAWQSETLWQPLRELTERLLVAYDLGEAWVASTLVVEPIFDRLWFVELARLARGSGDVLSAHVLQSLGLDALWHAEWASVLHHCAWAGGDEARSAIEAWVVHWWPLAERALASVLELWEFPVLERRRILLEAREERRGQWAALGMSGAVI